MAKVLRRVSVGKTKGGMDKMRPVVECSHCQAEVLCDNSWANACEVCGTEYNSAGQRLAPREQWGEETGERFS